MRTVFLIFCLIFIASCEDDVTVKPSAMLRLTYPEASFERVETDCPYSFEKNTEAIVDENAACGMRIFYPSMKATLFLTYREVTENSLDGMLTDAQKLVYDRNAQARGIPQYPFVNEDANTYGTLYEINGDVASQSKFYLTDSTQNFLVGALYFEVKPNFDSIYPAVEYMREDIRRLMETVKWQ